MTQDEAAHVKWLNTPDGLRAILDRAMREASPAQLKMIALYAARVMQTPPDWTPSA